MAYLVVAYPNLSQKDFDWIQEYRRKNDERFFSVVEPHITLVFSVHDMEREAFIQEIRKQVSEVKSMDFEMKVATVNQDDSGEYYHEFLVPDRGYSDMVKLHDRLYSGALKGYLRLDIDFIPHIGIGNSDDAAVSKKRVDTLNARNFEIKGAVKMLDILEYSGGTVKTIERIELSS